MREYDYLECCSSGSCEVCGGLQGLVRASVRDEEQPKRPCWRSECRNGCYYPAACSERWPVRACCGERHGGVYCPVTHGH